MVVDFESVQQGINIAPGCGEYLEYDPDFVALQQAAVGKSEQQFGDTIIPAESPDWNQVHKLGLSLLERSLDIQVLILLARAGLERQGLQAWEQPIRLLCDGLEKHWEDIHPRLEIDEEEDPMLRMNALAELGDVAGMVRALRAAILLQESGITLTVRDAETLLEGNARNEGVTAFPGGRARLVELLSGSAAQDPRLQALLNVHDCLERIVALVREKLGESWVPDLHALLKPLELIAQAARTGRAATTLAEAEAEISATDVSAGQSQERVEAPVVAPFSWQDVSVQSREDAALLLEKARVYFEVHESSHPASQLIRRVEQLLPLDFYQLVHQLAPQGRAELDVLMPRMDASGS